MREEEGYCDECIHLTKKKNYTVSCRKGHLNSGFILVPTKDGLGFGRPDDCKDWKGRSDGKM